MSFFKMSEFIDITATLDGRIHGSRNNLVWRERSDPPLQIGMVTVRKWIQFSVLVLWRKTGETLNSDVLRTESSDHLLLAQL